MPSFRIETPREQKAFSQTRKQTKEALALATHVLRECLMGNVLPALVRTGLGVQNIFWRFVY